jgi:hypothetical protein
MKHFVAEALLKTQYHGEDTSPLLVRKNMKVKNTTSSAKMSFHNLALVFFADNQATSAQASHRKTYQDQGSRLLDYPVHCQVIVVIQPSNCIQS